MIEMIGMRAQVFFGCQRNATVAPVDRIASEYDLCACVRHRFRESRNKSKTQTCLSSSTNICRPEIYLINNKLWNSQERKNYLLLVQVVIWWSLVTPYWNLPLEHFLEECLSEIFSWKSSQEFGKGWVIPLDTEKPFSNRSWLELEL